MTDLKKVAEDITARKDELGFAAFTSAGMDGSSDWRFKTHLANLPIYFEYQADGINSTDAIKGTYLDNYKAIFDLYINNSTCAPADLSGKTGDRLRERVPERQGRVLPERFLGVYPLCPPSTPMTRWP